MPSEIKKKDNIELNDTPVDIGEKLDAKDELKKDNEDSKLEVKKNKFSNQRTDTGFKKNFRKRTPFRKEKPEFEQKILSLRRVTRVMAGGRRFSFSVAMVVGDKKGRVGFGKGKSSDTTLAIEKAVRNAKKNMVKINLTDEGSIMYDVSGKYKSSEVAIRPVHGKGLAAGGAVRTVLEFAGAKEAGAKILSRSKNHINNAKATFVALRPFSEKVEVNLNSTDRNKRTFKPRKFGNNKPIVGSNFGNKISREISEKEIKKEKNK